MTAISTTAVNAASKPVLNAAAAAATAASAAAPVAKILGDTLSLSASEDHWEDERATGLTQLDAAKDEAKRRWAGGGLVAMGGIGVTGLGIMGVNTLPYLGFVGLFLGGVAIAGAGLYYAFTGAKMVSEAHQALNVQGI